MSTGAAVPPLRQRLEELRDRLEGEDRQTIEDVIEWSDRARVVGIGYHRLRGRVLYNLADNPPAADPLDRHAHTRALVRMAAVVDEVTQELSVVGGRLGESKAGQEGAG